MSEDRWNLRRLGHRYRQPGENPARTPDFVIIGVAKGGTTALASHLGEHPSVYMVPTKELHFFERDFEKGSDWYLAQFGAAPPGTLAGEATPNYLSNLQAPARMAAVMPDAKLIVILREPVDRAYSHYWMQRAKFPDGADFEEVVRREIEGRPGPSRHPLYLADGRYVRQLERLYEYFPRESVLVVLYEDFRSDPRGVFARVCRFLGIDDSFEPESLGRSINPTRRARSERIRRLMLRLRLGRWLPVRFVVWLDGRNRTGGYPPIDPSLRDELRRTFEEDNARLADLLGVDLSHWGPPPSDEPDGRGERSTTTKSH